MDSVALVKWDGDFSKVLEEGLDLLGGYGVLRSPFIIKPNICTGNDKTGYATTDVRLVDALIDLVLRQESDLEILVVESDSESKFADNAFKNLGYKKLEQRYKEKGFNVSLLNISQSSIIPARLDGLHLKNPDLPEVTLGSKYLVSVAVAKTHGLAFITGTLKNLFGLIPRKDQSFYHNRISEVIVDINRLVRPDLCIVDARVGLEGWEGPKKRQINAFLLGRNPASVDATMARLMELNPERIRHLVKAEKFNLGSLHPKILGAALDSMVVQFKLPSNLSPRAKL
ncbi:MAG: DUF362 domain-containing protein [Candidatus Bathyarchaeota archaeon]